MNDSNRKEMSRRNMECRRVFGDTKFAYEKKHSSCLLTRRKFRVSHVDLLSS